MLIMVVILIAAVQFSLHSSVHRTSGLDDANSGSNNNRNNNPISMAASSSDKLANTKAIPRINSPDKTDNQSSSSSFPVHYTTFSTACSASQNWQSFMFFYFAAKVRQPGYVVRIASGCTMVFMLSAGSLAAPQFLGGPRTLWFTSIVYDFFFQSFNWPRGAAYAFILLVACIAFVLLMLRVFKVSLGETIR